MKLKGRTIQLAALHIIIFFGLSMLFLLLSILSFYLRLHNGLRILFIVLTIINVLIDTIFWYFGDCLLEWKYYYKKYKLRFNVK